MCWTPLSLLKVLVLELETRLQKERERLGELRKKHYELAGVAEGWGEDDQGEPQVKTAGGWLLTMITDD